MNTFVKQLLEKSLKHKSHTFIKSTLFKAFDNVFIQDATHYKLPRSLAEFFPGSYSKNGKSATAKIQAVFNLTLGVFVDFKLGCFRDNDPRFTGLGARRCLSVYKKYGKKGFNHKGFGILCTGCL